MLVSRRFLVLLAAFRATLTCQAQQVVPYPTGVYGTWPVDAPIPYLDMQCPTAGPSRGGLLIPNQGVVGILLQVP
jgi:hypothetical protein